MFRKIRTKTTISLILAGLVPLGMLLLFSVADTSTRIRKEKLQSRHAVIDEVGKQVERIVDHAVGYMGVLATNPLLIDEDVVAGDRRRELLRARDALFAEVTLLDEDGFVIDSTSKKGAMAKESSAWFKRARDERSACVSSPMKPPHANRLMMSAYLPVESGQGVQTAVIKATLPFDRINDVLRDIETADHGDVMLLDAYGNILTHPDPQRLLEKFDERQEADHWVNERSGTYRSAAGVDQLFVATEVKLSHQLEYTRGWSLVWMENEKSLLAVVHKNRVHHAMAAAAGLIFAIGLGLIVGRRFAKPVSNIAGAAQKAAGGDLSVRANVTTKDEVGDLGRAFNRMMDELETSDQQVKASLEERTESLLLAESTMAQLRSTYEAVDDGLLVVDREGKIIQMNSAFAEMFDLPSRNYTEMAVADLYQWLHKCCSDKDLFEERWKHYKSNAEERGEELMATSFPSEKFLRVFTSPVRNTVSPEPFARLWIFRDETDLRQLEDQLRQSQKMEAVGQLAGGIAHDFNNLLTGISGNLALALTKMDTRDAHEIKKHLQTAQGASERSAALVRQLLGYSRKGALELRVCDVNEIVEETDGILAHTLDKKISVSLELDHDLWDVEMDPNQMQQVVMNLCVNARDAIDGAGTITVGTRMKRVSEQECRGVMEACEPGDYVVISVTDTGSGMTAEQQAKMFEPFYTTKEQGKGTGLGLAMCYGIVKQHGGWITCRSTLDVGTCFSILLPRSTKAASATQSTALIDFDTVGDPSQFTILLADDEPAVRMVAESLLRREGFDVHTAENGLEAVRISRDLGADLDLAILDLTMPKLSGGEAFAIMSEEFPSRPVLICSGYLLDLEGFGEDTGHTPAGFIQKPYKLETMKNEIARVLGSERSTSSEAAKNDLALPS